MQKLSLVATFFAGSNQDEPIGTNVLSFNVVQIQGAFNSSSNTFTTPFAGLYWLIISAGVPGSNQCEIRIRGINKMCDLVRAHTTYTSNADTLSREGLLDLPENSEIFLSTTYPLSNDGNMQTTFSSFSIEETMSRIVGFQVALSIGTYQTGNIAFDKVLIDTNDRWNTATNDYTVQIGGIYVLNMLTGAVSGQPHSITLRQNSLDVCEIYFTSTSQVAEDMLSKTVLRLGNVNDKFSIYLRSGNVYSDIRYFTSFSGFLYSPKSTAVAWYVARTSGLISGLVDPVPFEEIIININDVGTGWDPTTNRFTAPKDGIYYVSLCAGFQNNYYVNLVLLLNDDPVTNIQILSNSRNGYDTRSRSIIVRLKEGDELRVVLPRGYGLYSNSNRLTSFAGFRLHD